MATWTYFRESSKIDPRQINANFQTVRLGSVLPRGDIEKMNPTGSAYNLGSTSKKWDYAIANRIDIKSTTCIDQFQHQSGETANTSGMIYLSGKITKQTTTSGLVVLGATYQNKGFPAGTFVTGTLFYRRVYKLTKPANTLTSNRVAHGIPDMPQNILSIRGFTNRTVLDTTTTYSESIYFWVVVDSVNVYYMEMAGTGPSEQICRATIEYL